MSQTADGPETVMVKCHPIDFEQTRAELEQRGYAVVSAETDRGCLIVIGARKACTCDLCREEQ